MNIIPMIILTLPIISPTVVQLGFDPIWFGVVMVVMFSHIAALLPGSMRWDELGKSCHLSYSYISSWLSFPKEG